MTKALAPCVTRISTVWRQMDVFRFAVVAVIFTIPITRPIFLSCWFSISSLLECGFIRLNWYSIKCSAGVFPTVIEAFWSLLVACLISTFLMSGWFRSPSADVRRYGSSRFHIAFAKVADIVFSIRRMASSISCIPELYSKETCRSVTIIVATSPQRMVHATILGARCRFRKFFKNNGFILSVVMLRVRLKKRFIAMFRIRWLEVNSR